jgi:transcriptional regulator with XRE-family HTH domain
VIEPKVYRVLREIKGQPQADVAMAAGINQPRLSMYERGARRPTRQDAARLEEELALGERQESEETARYALALIEERTVQLMFTDGWRVGLYRDRDFAETAANGLRRAGVSAVVVPVWVQGAYEAVIAWKGARAARVEDVYLVDGKGEPKANSLATTEHALAIAAWFDHDDAHETVDYSAILASSFLDHVTESTEAAVTAIQ